MGAAWSEGGALCGPADDEPGSYGDDPAMPEHGALGAAWSERGALCGAADEPDSCGQRDNEPKQLSRLYSNVVRMILQIWFLPMEKPATSDMLQLPTKALHNNSAGLK